MTGIKRNSEQKINELLDMFPVVAVIGPRQCGKTTLCEQIRPNWLKVDLERPSDLSRVSRDVEHFFGQYSEHVFIDEAQRLPGVFDMLRVVVDEQRGKKGRFLISGSSSFELLNHISESLAGRVAIVELGTLKANEIYEKPLSAFYTCLQQPLTPQHIENLPQPELSLEEMGNAWFRGGYPEPVLSSANQFYQQWMENYEQTYINRDIANLFPRLNKIAYRRFLSMLSRLSSSILNKSDLGRALEVNEGSIRTFLKIADGTFIWRQLPSYERNVSKSIIKMPKGYMRDSGLLHSLLGIVTQDALFNDPIVGHSFEGFVVDEIIKGLSATLLTHWSYHYYRTRAGAEIDLILEGPFGLLPIEVKYGTVINNRQLKSLSDFVAAHSCPFGLVINQSKQACWLSKSIFQLPVNYL